MPVGPLARCALQRESLPGGLRADGLRGGHVVQRELRRGLQEVPTEDSDAAAEWRRALRCPVRGGRGLQRRSVRRSRSVAELKSFGAVS